MQWCRYWSQWCYKFESITLAYKHWKVIISILIKWVVYLVRVSNGWVYANLLDFLWDPPLEPCLIPAAHRVLCVSLPGRTPFAWMLKKRNCCYYGDHPPIIFTCLHKVLVRKHVQIQESTIKHSNWSIKQLAWLQTGTQSSPNPNLTSISQFIWNQSITVN